MRKAATYAAVATLTVGSAIGALAAAPSASTGNATTALHQRIVAMESRALAQHDTQLAAALARADASLASRAHTGSTHGNRHGNACPPQSQGGRHGVTDPPCGVPSGALPICPSPSPQAGNTPPCGNGQGQGPGGGSGGGGGGGGTATCGPADAGGTAPAGPVTNPLYQIGEQISSNGGAPLGDAVQSLACAVNGLTGL
ncbi:MAG TPA: hypothetical protein VFJ17_00660 [Mycobacteriales bacterium]|jgi:hypothetical protein|nr:hypothetical protein [Mycobacteriales bacterium]